MKKPLLRARKPSRFTPCPDGCNDHREYDDKSSLARPNLKDLETSHLEATERLAQFKLQSLLLSHVSGKDSPMRGTSVQDDIVTQMRSLREGAYAKLIEQMGSEPSVMRRLLMLAGRMLAQDSNAEEVLVRKKLIRKLLEEDLFFAVNDIYVRAQVPGMFYRIVGARCMKERPISLQALYSMKTVNQDALQLFYKIALRQIIVREKAAAKRHRQENFESLYLYAGAAGANT